MVLAQPGSLRFHFSYPGGFHPTLVLAQPAQQKNKKGGERVSIPHWFSLNIQIILEFCGQSRVSIPHWFSLNKKAMEKMSVDVYVSIPHWFSLNRLTCLDCFVRILFPSHIGSRSTKAGKISIMASLIRFHPTLVLAQPKPVR